ncbi:WecB/TagA/CpsF family glycosyltransferase [Amnibacterium endophyticum]|uniref:WecB/TagA/CpsF family glycosyltransferase n=1 Tax=Amnibacterium endophyticum TaxID=2109337 RepID=A0ABW4L9F4_9MICO
MLDGSVPPGAYAIGRIFCEPLTYREAEARIDGFVDSDRPHLVLTPNMAQVEQADRSPHLAEAFRSASMATPDGWPLVAALRLLGARSARTRVTGSDLTPLLCAPDRRVAIVGGRDDSARLAADELVRRNPRLRVVLVEPVPPAELADPRAREALVARIADAGADLIFVGLGVPKQERLALEVLDALDRGVVLCVGATIEFIAGTVPRSPLWMQRLGVEWLHRTLRDPRSMAKRYVTSLPTFVWHVAGALRAGAAARRRTGAGSTGAGDSAQVLRNGWWLVLAGAAGGFGVALMMTLAAASLRAEDWIDLALGMVVGALAGLGLAVLRSRYVHG